ncbi:hypothetical protein [Erwinia sp.]|uniref:hypothetical protein n=1 Tax=Erwinia citreus TaxID=558 RepID=UPI00289F5A24|nr:hypothetical protein [Erwinia sp.]
MEQVTETFGFLYFLKYVPLLGAVLFWAIYMYTRRQYDSYARMKYRKLWNDLPRHSAAESKEETLNMMIAAKKRQIGVSFRSAVMFSAIAVFWFFYMR